MDRNLGAWTCHREESEMVGGAGWDFLSPAIPPRTVLTGQASPCGASKVLTSQFITQIDEGLIYNQSITYPTLHFYCQ